MMLGPAIELGLTTPVLATDPAESAAAVAARVQLGRHDDERSVRELAADVEVLTFDHEHVPTALLERLEQEGVAAVRPGPSALVHAQDRKSTRLNSSHVSISYAVFCLKKKTSQSSRAFGLVSAPPPP